MSATIGDFLEAAWNDHTTDPRAVAARLADARPLLEREPEQAGGFLGLAEHVLIGHLGDADALEPWLAMAAPLVARHPEAAPSLERARLAARLMRGADPRSGEQAVATRVRACGTAVNGFMSLGDFDRARRLLEDAATLARGDGGTDAVKALAATFNNVATQLLDGARSPDTDWLMMEAAQKSRDTWAEVGTWLNVERGEYILALCAAAAGDAANSVGHARACLEICGANGADAFERFFGHEALARGLLAGGERAAAASELPTMRGLLTGIDDDGNKAYAQSCLDKLQGLVNPA